MACGNELLDFKPLPEPVMNCCQLAHQEQIVVKFQSKYKYLKKKPIFEKFDSKWQHLDTCVNLSSLDKKMPFRIGHFQMHFREWKMLYFD